MNRLPRKFNEIVCVLALTTPIVTRNELGRVFRSDIDRRWLYVKFVVRLWSFDRNRRKTVLFTGYTRLSNELICSEMIAGGVSTEVEE